MLHRAEIKGIEYLINIKIAPSNRSFLISIVPEDFATTPICTTSHSAAYAMSFISKVVESYDLPFAILAELTMKDTLHI